MKKFAKLLLKTETLTSIRESPTSWILLNIQILSCFKSNWKTSFFLPICIFLLFQIFDNLPKILGLYLALFPANEDHTKIIIQTSNLIGTKKLKEGFYLFSKS